VLLQNANDLFFAESSFHIIPSMDSALLLYCFLAYFIGEMSEAGGSLEKKKNQKIERA
jgi:hypothetical protein